MSALNARSQYWCYTNYAVGTTNIRSWNTRQKNAVTATYLVVGIETCPTTQRIHEQGYVEYDREVSGQQLAKAFPGIHWASRRGTAVQASVYCKKEGNWTEEGTISAPEQGKRTDLNTVKEMALAGASMKAITAVAETFQAMRMAEKIREYHEPKRDWKPHVIWYWGPTGSGKTRRAWEEAKGLGETWQSSGSLKWWQGYDGHENVILDDFRGDFCPLHMLLNILDRYPFSVEYKGGSRQLLAKRIWITCPYPPQAIYQDRADRGEDIKQLLRRIDKIEHIPASTVLDTDHVIAVELAVPGSQQDDNISYQWI